MSSVFEIIIKAVDEASSVIDGVNQKMNESGSSIGDSMANAGKTAGIAMGAVGLAAGAGAVASTLAFANFEGQMNEVFTLMPGMTDQAMGSMTGQVKDFSREFGTLPGEVVPALYSAISAGVPSDNVFGFLETAQKAATGGVTDLGTAVDGISSVVNAYGEDVLGAGEASDLMFTAVKLGKTDFSQLSQSLFQVIPTASSLGVEFGDVTAGLAALTAQGVPTSVATTQMRQLFVELSQEGGKASTMFEQLAGKSFKQFIAEGGNTAEALDIMLKGADDLGVGVNDLFGSVEAGSAALSLAGSETFSKNIDEMAKSAGATDTAFNQMEKGLGRDLAKIKANLAVMVLEIGQRVAPVFAKLSQAALEHFPRIQQAIQNAFESAAPYIETAISVIETVGSTLMTVLTPVIGFLEGNFKPVMVGVGAVLVTIFTAWAISAGAAAVSTIVALAPVIAVLAAIGVAAALLYAAWSSNFLGIQDIVMTVFGFLQEYIPPILSGIWETIQVVLAAILETWNAVWPHLSTVIGLVWEGIKLYIETYVAFIQAVIETALVVIQTVWDTVWPLLLTVIQTVWPIIQESVTSAIAVIQEVIQAALTVLQTVWEAVRGLIRDYVPPVWEVIKTAVSTAIDAVKSTIDTVTGAIQSVWEAVWGLIRDYVPPIWDAIKTTVETVIETIATVIDTVMGTIQSVWETVWGTVKSVAETIWGEIESAIDTAINAVQTVIETVLGTIEGVWETVWGTVKTVAETLWGEIETVIDTASNAVQTVIETVLGESETAWDTVGNAVLTLARDIWDGASGIYNTVKGSIESVKTFLGNTMDTISGAWDTAWSAVRDTVTGMWDEIAGAVTTGINEVISAINTFIGYFNGISITVPTINIPSVDVPGVGTIGGGSLGGFTVSMPQVPTIPSLNTGGMLTADSLFFGHRGEHVINPSNSRNIDSLSKALEMALGKSGAGGGVTVPVQFMGPVTINATDRREAERAAGDIGFSVWQQLRKRGLR